MTAAALLKKARLSAGLTQAELARRASTTQSVIARLEANGANPRLATLEKVIAATGHSVELEVRPISGEFAETDVDETMIVANRRLSPGQRLAAFQQAYGNLAELVDAARRGNGS